MKDRSRNGSILFILGSDIECAVVCGFLFFRDERFSLSFLRGMEIDCEWDSDVDVRLQEDFRVLQSDANNPSVQFRCFLLCGERLFIGRDILCRCDAFPGVSGETAVFVHLFVSNF